MRYEPIDNDLFTYNRIQLLAKVKPNSLLIINANDEMPRNGDQYHPYRQHSDLFYLTGIEQEKTLLMLYRDHPQTELQQILFIIRPNETLETWEGRKLRAEEAKLISGIGNVKFTDELEAVLRDLMIQASRVYVNQNEYPKFAPEVPSRDDRFVAVLKKQFPTHHYERLAPLLWSLRAGKSSYETDLMQKAINITEEAFDRVLKMVKPGVKEYEVEAEIIYEFTKQGATHAYQPIVAAGINGCSLHYHLNDQPCTDGTLLLMDFGAEYANFAADITRTIPVNGTFTPRQRDCYTAVLRVLRRATRLYVPGNTINNINRQVNLMMEKEMVSLGLFTLDDIKNQPPDKPLYTKYFMHGVAHFLGLDVHDVGGRDVPLTTGMVVTCEPGLYIKEEALGIRIEDNIMVNDSPINLSFNIPREIDEIETIMRERKNHNPDIQS